MRAEGYTLLCPQMSPIHFDLLEPASESVGYHIVIPDTNNKAAVDTGLKYVNNDACYPSLIVVGQLMNAIVVRQVRLTDTAGDHNDADRRRMPCLELPELYPPCIGEERTRAYPGHLHQRQWHGEEQRLSLYHSHADPTRCRR